MTIRSRIFAGFFLVCAGTVIFAGLGLYALLGDAVRKDIESGLSSTSTVLMEMVSTSVKVSVRNHLRAVAEKNRDIVARLHARAMRGEMTEAQAKALARDILLSQAIGKTGYIYCLTSRGMLDVHPVAATGTDLADHAFIQRQTIEKNGYIEYFWKNPGEPAPRHKALYMAYFEPWDWIISASSYREEFKNLVDVEDFRPGIEGLRFGRDGYAFVLDSAGNVVLHPYAKGNVLEQLDAHGQPLIREIVSRKFGKIHYRWKNPGEDKARKKIATFSYIPEVDWVVCATAYEADFDAPLRHLRNSVLGIVAVTLCLGLFFSWRIGRSVTGPLREIVKGFGTAMEGDFSVRLTPRENDELGTVAQCFNGFMERIQEYDQSLRREIKERRAAVKGEKLLRGHLQEVIDSMPAMVLGVDRERRITLWNQRAEEMLGQNAGGVLGSPVMDVCPVCATFTDLMDEAIRERRPMTRDRIPGVRDGRTVYHCLEVSPLPGGNGAVIVISDVTTRVQAEEMMVQSEKMLSVGGLAAGMAHEINNPLGGIIQGAQNLGRRLSADFPANLQDAAEAGFSMESLARYMELRKIPRIIEGIQESGKRAAMIVANMLEFSRVSAASRSSHDVVELLEKALLLAQSDYDLKRSYDFKAITLHREFESGLPPVICSGIEIEQVFLNLFRNAAQALAGVEHPELRLSASREDGWLRVEVEDNGPGMDEETRKRIFEPFFTTKEVGQGTGLGLSVSYFIIADKHSGTFAVDSVPGRGARFIIRLPL
ncbi:cache domain-containing protein [Desulfocurvus sp. DL9XJH121]